VDDRADHLVPLDVAGVQVRRDDHIAECDLLDWLDRAFTSELLTRLRLRNAAPVGPQLWTRTAIISAST
jgi:hypothetical protein